jgi:HK97 family phage major capsid protein
MAETPTATAPNPTTPAPAGGAKTKVNSAALVKTANALIEKINTQQKQLDVLKKEPNYGGRFKALDAPPNVTRQLGEKQYKLLNVAKLARGYCKEADCVEEVQIHKKLFDVYGGDNNPNWSPALMANQAWLIPLHTSYLPTDSTKAEQLQVEIRQKMYGDHTQSDPDQVRWLQQKALGTLLDTAGGTFVQPPQIIELLEMQYKLEAFARAGATQIPMMPNGRAYISKVQAGATAGYVGEGQTLSNSQLTTGQAMLTAKKVYVLTPINNELLRFGMPATENMIRTDMAEQAALFIDAEMFTGTGGTHLTGLMNSTAYPQAAPPWVQGVDKVLQYQSSTPAPKGIGTNGNTLQPEDLDRMVNGLPDRVSKDQVCLVMTRTLYGAISSRRAGVLAGGDELGTFVNQRVLGISGQIEETVNGYRVAWSANVPQNRVKGSGSTLTAAIAGRFSDWVVARLGVGEIVANSWSDTYWTNDQTGLRLIQQVDCAPRYLASFNIYDFLLNG